MLSQSGVGWIGGGGGGGGAVNGPTDVKGQLDPSPVYTCISELLDKPRAFASSVVKPFFSVLLTAVKKENKKGKNIVSNATSCIIVCLIIHEEMIKD